MTHAQILSLTLLAVLPLGAQANAFLGQVREGNHQKASARFERALLDELEDVLGSEHRRFTERRIQKLEDAVLPTFKAMRKNEHGKLSHGAVSYLLHRLFVQRHGWIIEGLSPTGGKEQSTWNESSASALFEDRVPEFVQSTFENRTGKFGLGVHEIAVVAATLEHLVHKESIERLRLAYQSMELQPEDEISPKEGEEVLDAYMTLYVLGFLIKGRTEMKPKDVKHLRNNIAEIYPTWPDTQKYIREVHETVAPSRDYYFFADLVTVIEEAGERYGRWQDLECRTLKNDLLQIEDTGAGGAGRVRLADFYKQALHHDKWQFSESQEFLRQNGALDESDPKNPRVIIPNYVNNPSNCIASSTYYSVCCIDECEGLLAHLEDKIGKPDGSPKEISAIVASLLSSSQTAERKLSPWLLQQLDDVAAHHAGKVPLHGRLFTQWMHFAYPRECAFPHVAGSVDPKHLVDMLDENLTTHAATKEDMEWHVEAVPERMENILDASTHEQVGLKSMEEELVVRCPIEPASTGTTVKSWLLRGIAMVGAVAAISMRLMRARPKGSHDPSIATSKYYV